MGNLIKKSTTSKTAFTRVELVAVLACLFLLGLVTLPLLGRSHTVGTEAVCMNNLRNLGRALLIYSDQNRNLVPEEGNLGSTIFHSSNTDAWYNLAVRPEFPAMTTFYLAKNYPLPNNGSIYSCPATITSLRPNVGWAMFMYAENNWLCVNKSTRSSGAQQTRLNQVSRPAQTILLAEVTPDDTIPALSGTHGSYAAARHEGAGVFSMVDGSVRLFRTNEFMHYDNSPAGEWYRDQYSTNSGYTSFPCYWWPSPTTPQ